MSTSFYDQRDSAVIVVPPSNPGETPRSLPCTFEGMHGKRLIVDAIEQIPVFAPVSVEFDDSLFLGDVVSCSKSQDGWNLEIKVEQVLSGLQSLMALRAGLLGESVPQSLGLIPFGARN